MKPVRRVVGRAVPLDRADVDTDQIIPSDWLKRIERTGYAAGLFSEWRKDPAFVLNDPRYRGANILLAGENFGCGSSREHAAWAIQEHGFAAVVAPSFADIFQNNCVKAGLLTARTPAEVVRTLVRAAERDPSLEIAIDVASRRIVAPGASVDAAFELDDVSRRRLLEGADDIDLAMRNEQAIAAYEARRASWLPRTSRSA